MPQSAEGVAGASVPVNSLAEVKCTQPVEGRLAGGNRRRARDYGTAQSTGRAAAEPPARAHDEAAHLSGAGKPGRTRVCANDPTDWLTGDAGGRRGDPGDGNPSRLPEHAPPDGLAGAAGAPERLSEQSGARASAHRRARGVVA